MNVNYTFPLIVYQSFCVFTIDTLQYPYASRNATLVGTDPSHQRRCTATATQSGETKGVLVLRTHLNARKYNSSLIAAIFNAPGL
jgi:hypothetical protein